MAFPGRLGPGQEPFPLDLGAAIDNLFDCGEIKLSEGGDRITILGKPEFAAELHELLRPVKQK